MGLRRELVSELRGHLDELPPGTDLGERLGEPHEYPAEMRAAAGLERRRRLVGPAGATAAQRDPDRRRADGDRARHGAVEWIDSYQPLAFANLQPVPRPLCRLACRRQRGERGSWILFDFPVRYSFLWRTATAEIPVPEELAIVFRKNSCR